ncbi:MAG TPA: hypothetical protein V6C97_07345, partial [Oculatellaceae cyanobacterium]
TPWTLTSSGAVELDAALSFVRDSGSQCGADIAIGSAASIELVTVTGNDDDDANAHPFRWHRFNRFFFFTFAFGSSRNTVLSLSASRDRQMQHRFEVQHSRAIVTKYPARSNTRFQPTPFVGTIPVKL